MMAGCNKSDTAETTALTAIYCHYCGCFRKVTTAAVTTAAVTAETTVSDLITVSRLYRIRKVGIRFIFQDLGSGTAKWRLTADRRMTGAFDYRTYRYVEWCLPYNSDEWPDVVHVSFYAKNYVR